MHALILASRVGLLILAVIPITVLVMLLEDVKASTVSVRAYLATATTNVAANVFWAIVRDRDECVLW